MLRGFQAATACLQPARVGWQVGVARCTQPRQPHSAARGTCCCKQPRQPAVAAPSAPTARHSLSHLPPTLPPTSSAAAAGATAAAGTAATCFRLYLPPRSQRLCSTCSCACRKLLPLLLLPPAAAATAAAAAATAEQVAAAAPKVVRHGLVLGREVLQELGGSGGGVGGGVRTQHFVVPVWWRGTGEGSTRGKGLQGAPCVCMCAASCGEWERQQAGPRGRAGGHPHLH